MNCQKLADLKERFLDFKRTFLISSILKLSSIHFTAFLSPYSKILSIKNKSISFYLISENLHPKNIALEIEEVFSYSTNEK